jgi:hypothetical protein
MNIQPAPSLASRPPVLFRSPVCLNRELIDVLPAGSWLNKPAYLVGGGPSLEGFNWKLLRGRRTIAVNVAFYNFEPTIIFSMDTRCLNWIVGGTYENKFPGLRERFEKTTAYKVWLLTYTAQLREDIFVVRVLKNYDYGLREFSWDLRAGIGHGNNSGFAAFNLAVLLGANPIYLLGYDMKHKDGKSHFHGGHPIPQDEAKAISYAAAFEKIAPELAKRGIRIINLNPDSGLRCFEFQKPEEALAC